MDLKVLFLFGHLVGLALGLGGASVSDVFFMRILKKKQITEADHRNLKVLSRFVWTGLTVLILSGLGFLWLTYDRTGEMPKILNSPRFQAKLTLVTIVLINGLVFHFKVFPLLKSAIGKKGQLAKHRWLFAITGAISVTSWYSIVAFALLREVTMPLAGWLGIYLVALSGGILTARFVIGRLVKPS